MNNELNNSMVVIPSIKSFFALHGLSINKVKTLTGVSRKTLTKLVLGNEVRQDVIGRMIDGLTAADIDCSPISLALNSETQLEQQSIPKVSGKNVLPFNTGDKSPSKNPLEAAQNKINTAQAKMEELSELVSEMNVMLRDPEPLISKHNFLEFGFSCEDMQTKLSQLYVRLAMEKPKFN